MKKKVFRLLALALAIGMIMTGCSSGGSDETNSPETPNSSSAEETVAPSGDTFDNFVRPRVVDAPKIGFLVQYANAESMIRSQRQAEIEVAHRGWEIVVNVFEKADNFRDAFLNMVNQDVDAIVICNTESMDSRVDLIAMAREKGIGVYCNDNQVVEGVIANTTMPSGVAALEIGYKIGEDHDWDLNMAVLNYKTGQVHLERAYPFEGLLNGVYPNYTLLAEGDASSGTQGSSQACFEFTQAWLQKYGDDLNGIFATCDEMAFGAVEAIVQSGDTTGEKCFVTGIDGGNQAWRYIRENTPFQYCYSQPFELFTHKLFEIIDQIQVQGLNPGDEGCDISRIGQAVYSTGMIVTRDNVPEVGASVHEVYGYYGGDPDDVSAWYNWTEGPDVYTVTDGE